MIKIAIVLAAAKGNARIEICSIVMFEIPDAMNRFSPSGGVWKPIPSVADHHHTEVDRVDTH